MNEQAPTRARMLNGNPHADLEQIAQNDLTGECLRGLDHRSELQLLDR
jgi:hypothetical protein